MPIAELYDSYNDDSNVDDSDNDDLANQHSDEHEHLEQPNEPNVNTHNNNADSVVGNPFKRNDPYHQSCHREKHDWVTATGSNDPIGRFDFDRLHWLVFQLSFLTFPELFLFIEVQSKPESVLPRLWRGASF